MKRYITPKTLPEIEKRLERQLRLYKSRFMDEEELVIFGKEDLQFILDLTPSMVKNLLMRRKLPFSQSDKKFYIQASSIRRLLDHYRGLYGYLHPG